MFLNTPLRLSIVVCAHNEEARLRECLLSLRGQKANPREFEIVVVDDGSTDGTADIVRDVLLDSWSDEQPDVLFVSLGHGGLSNARNQGIRGSRAGLIAFIDGDAMAPKDWVSRILNAFESRPELGVLGGRIDIANPISKTASLLHACHFDFFDRDQIIGCHMIFRRDVFDRVGGFASCFRSRGDETYLVERAASYFKVSKDDSLLVWHERPESVLCWLRERHANGRFFGWVERLTGASPRRRLRGAMARTVTLSPWVLLLLSLATPWCLWLTLPGTACVLRRLMRGGRASFVHRACRTRFAGAWAWLRSLQGLTYCVLGDARSDWGYLRSLLEKVPEARTSLEERDGVILETVERRFESSPETQTTHGVERL